MTGRIARLVALALTLTVWGGPARVGHGATPDADAAARRPTRLMEDMVGRTVEIPLNIKKVYSTSPAGTVLVYVLAPELLAGWNYPLTPAEQAWIPQPYRSLPVLGGWFSTGVTANLEEIVRARPDLILSMGTTDTLSVSQSERLQQQSGIPVLMMSGHLEQLPAALEFAGRLFQCSQRATQLAGYAARVLAEARAAAASQTPRVRIYYAQGPRGLETDPAGSYHTEILDLLGGINVAQGLPRSGKGRVTVSPEQVLAWDPDLIIAGYDTGRQPNLQRGRLTEDPVWRQLKAVRQGRVVVTPQVPFNWFDRPPSVNRLIGVRWVGRLLHPKAFGGDLRKDVCEFYKLFYRLELTDEQVDDLLRFALPSAGPDPE
ncbi:MAG: ABC transporter substrate-binding protein [Candidatus Sumerlaeaceae bacterium]|nr:ABC transporter substrate-binding protein [Candidatus Sumerlaeaceae bacterium]